MQVVIYIYIYKYISFTDTKINDVVEACHLVQSSDSKCHTDRPVRHKRMACWLYLSLCKYVFGISSSSGSCNSTSSVAVLFSLHCTWSMCFDIVDSIVAAVVAGDMGAIAGAVPAKEKGGRPHPCDAGVLCTSLGLSVTVCTVAACATRYTICLSKPGVLMSTRAQRRRRWYWHSRVSSWCCRCCRRWARDSRGRSKCQVSPMVMLFVLQSDCSSIGRAV